MRHFLVWVILFGGCQSAEVDVLKTEDKGTAVSEPVAAAPPRDEASSRPKAEDSVQQGRGPVLVTAQDWARLGQGVKPSNHSSKDFVGAKACSRCHSSIHSDWNSSTHGRAGGPPSPATVIPDFSGMPLVFLDAQVFPKDETGYTCFGLSFPASLTMC